MYIAAMITTYYCSHVGLIKLKWVRKTLNWCQWVLSMTTSINGLPGIKVNIPITVMAEYVYNIVLVFDSQ